jgi:hypothetical protein
MSLTATELIASGESRRLCRQNNPSLKVTNVTGYLFDTYSVKTIWFLQRRDSPDAIKFIAFSEPEPQTGFKFYEKVFVIVIGAFESLIIVPTFFALITFFASNCF